MSGSEGSSPPGAAAPHEGAVAGGGSGTRGGATLPKGGVGRNVKAILDATERPVRLALASVALGLALLVAVPLYLWRRPRADAAPPAEAAALASAAPPAQTATPLEEAAENAGLRLSEARVLECQDPGSQRTAPAACDHLVPVEKALAEAIVAAASCVPAASGAHGGSLVYVADVSFRRRRHPFEVRVPADGRRLTGARGVATASACARAVRKELQATGPAALAALQGGAAASEAGGAGGAAAPPAHARYKIAIAVAYGEHP